MLAPITTFQYITFQYITFQYITFQYFHYKLWENIFYTSDTDDRKIIFKPLGCLSLKCLLHANVNARINDGHASYFAEELCFLAPQRWSSLAYL